MWETAHESANPVLGDQVSVELAAEWPFEPGVFFAALRDERWIDERNGVWEIHDYWHHTPAYVKDRLRKQQEREEKAVGFQDKSRNVPDGSRTVQAETPPIRPAPSCPAPSIPELGEEGASSRAGARPHPNGYTPEQLFADWNTTAEQTGLRQCRQLTPARRKIATQRLRDHPSGDFWREVIDRLGASAFCRGSKGWRAGIDFLLRPETHVKAMEGVYDDHVTPQDAKAAKNLGAARRFVAREASS